MEKFTILPYTEVDGIRTVSDSDIKLLFERTQADGLDAIVFYEGTVTTPEQFLSMARSDQCLFYILLEGADTVGYMWLNRFENHTARQHFCIFKEHWGRSIDIGRFTLKKLMHIPDETRVGGYLFDLLTGFVPAWNKRAINFAVKCGGETHGVIPNAIWNHQAQKSEDAVFIYYTREGA